MGQFMDNDSANFFNEPCIPSIPIREISQVPSTKHQITPPFKLFPPSRRENNRGILSMGIPVHIPHNKRYSPIKSFRSKCISIIGRIKLLQNKERGLFQFP